MARKKRKGDKPKQQPQAGEVINQLFGSLESDTGIEGDIAQLGTEPVVETEASASIPPKKNKFFFAFAVFVIIMAIIGCVSTVRFIGELSASIADNTSQKNEFAQFIFPVVVNDIAPFENVSDIPNTSKINCAIWNILINKETAQYENANGELIIPEYDVMASCKEIFGSTATMEHQSAGSAEVRFVYDENKHVYNASDDTRYLTYAPDILEITEADGNYTLTVGYVPPTVAGILGIEVEPEKYMEYTVHEWDGVKSLLSVRFSDYSAEQSGNNA